jgi:putative MATE family efflux protein
VRLIGSEQREVAAIALPALVTLAAEPMYLLVDTAIVGHLGTTELAALALAALVLGATVNLLNFLAYGTTAQVARLVGAGRDAEASVIGVQALWLAALIGVGVGLVVAALAGPIMGLLGGGETRAVSDAAARYLRISAISLPCALIAFAAQGYLRGVADLRVAVKVVVAANVANVVLEVWFVYGLNWGLDGSAAGTVVAQFAMAAAFVLIVAGRAGKLVRPSAAKLRSLVQIGAPIMIRTGALLASFLTAGAVLARVGPDSLGAHQIAFQLFIFLALVLDALAIAAQVLVGRALGAADSEAAMRVARRMCWWGLYAGLVLAGLLFAGATVLPQVFSGDGEVLDRAGELWPIFALMMPVAAVVFALDGILLGAGDVRYLAGAMVFAALGVLMPILLLALQFGWGVRGVWWGLMALMLARLATLLPRMLGGRWLRLGAA